MVPVEPSGVAIDTVAKVMRENGLFHDNYRIARQIHRAMIAAAQGEGSR